MCSFLDNTLLIFLVSLSGYIKNHKLQLGECWIFPFSFSAIIWRTVCVPMYLCLRGSEVGAELVQPLVSGETSKQRVPSWTLFSWSVLWSHLFLWHLLIKLLTVKPLHCLLVCPEGSAPSEDELRESVVTTPSSLLPSPSSLLSPNTTNLCNTRLISSLTYSSYPWLYLFHLTNVVFLLIFNFSLYIIFRIFYGSAYLPFNFFLVWGLLR